MANITIVIGNLGRDPETRTVNGTTVCNFSVADDLRLQRADRSWDKETRWYNVAVWGKRGETCASMLSKGSKVQVTGEVTLREWSDNNGVVKTNYEINAWNVQFVSDFGRSRNEGSLPSQSTSVEGDIPF